MLRKLLSNQHSKQDLPLFVTYQVFFLVNNWPWSEVDGASQVGNIHTCIIGIDA